MHLTMLHSAIGYTPWWGQGGDRFADGKHKLQARRKHKFEMVQPYQIQTILVGAALLLWPRSQDTR